MYKLVILLATVFCGANAGLIAGGSYAAGPALGAPLLGSVSYNAPEVTVVKQPITVDQPEVHYKSVPTVVHQTSVVKAAPVIAAPAVSYAAAPAISYAAAPALSYAAAPALSYAAAPAAVTYATQPALAYGGAYSALGYNYNNLAYSGLPAYGYAQAF